MFSRSCHPEPALALGPTECAKETAGQSLSLLCGLRTHLLLLILFQDRLDINPGLSAPALLVEVLRVSF